MATEQVTVLDAGTSGVRLRARDARHCGHCAMKSGCGHHLLYDSSLLQRREPSLHIPRTPAMPDNLDPGASMTLAIDEKRLMGLSLLHYGTPVLCLLIVTVLFRGLAGEGLLVLLAVAAFGAGLYLVSRLARIIDLPLTLSRPGACIVEAVPTPYPTPETRKLP